MVTSLYTSNESAQSLIASAEQLEAAAAAAEQNDVTAAVGVIAASASASQPARPALVTPPSGAVISAQVAFDSQAVRLFT
jgi:hypothetical protein